MQVTCSIFRTGNYLQKGFLFSFILGTAAVFTGCGGSDSDERMMAATGKAIQGIWAVQAVDGQPSEDGTTLAVMNENSQPITSEEAPGAIKAVYKNGVLYPHAAATAITQKIFVDYVAGTISAKIYSDLHSGGMRCHIEEVSSEQLMCQGASGAYTFHRGN